METKRIYKPRKNAEEKNNIVVDYFQSGLSLSKYCEAHDLSKSTLADWVKKYEESVNTSSVITTNNFIDVTKEIKEQSFIRSSGTILKEKIKDNDNRKITVRTPNGLELDFDISLLINVLEAFR